MATPKDTYLTQIALIQQRSGDRGLYLDDLDPARRNSRVAPLMLVERMKQNIKTKPLSLTQGTAVEEDPAGTKNDSNAAFTLSQTPDLATLNLYHNNVRVVRVASGASTGEFSISGITITMGLAPSSGDSLYAQYRTAT